MKPCRITNYCYGKNEFKSGVDISQNGWLAAILDFCYNKLHKDLMQYADATSVG